MAGAKRTPSKRKRQETTKEAAKTEADPRQIRRLNRQSVPGLLQALGTALADPLYQPALSHLATVHTPGDIRCPNPECGFDISQTVASRWATLLEESLEKVLNLAAEAILVKIRWPDGPRCPHEGCGSDDVRPVANRKPMPFRCGQCRKHYSVTLGTEHLKGCKLQPLKLVTALYFVAAHYPSMTNVQLADYVGVDETSARKLRRLLQGLMGDIFEDLSADEFQADEMYVGGSQSNRHAGERQLIRGRAGKTAICGIKDSETKEVRFLVADHVTAAVVHPFIERNTGPDARGHVDGHRAYPGIPGVKLKVLNRSNGDHFTNAIEAEWPEARQFLNPFRSVSREHLPLYVNELAWKRNSRGLPVWGLVEELASRLLAERRQDVEEASDQPEAPRGSVEPEPQGSPGKGSGASESAAAAGAQPPPSTENDLARRPPVQAKFSGSDWDDILAARPKPKRTRSTRSKKPVRSKGTSKAPDPDQLPLF